MCVCVLEAYFWTTPRRTERGKESSPSTTKNKKKANSKCSRNARQWDLIFRCEIRAMRGQDLFRARTRRLFQVFETISPCPSRATHDCATEAPARQGGWRKLDPKGRTWAAAVRRPSARPDPEEERPNKRTQHRITALLETVHHGRSFACVLFFFWCVLLLSVFERYATRPGPFPGWCWSPRKIDNLFIDFGHARANL